MAVGYGGKGQIGQAVLGLAQSVILTMVFLNLVGKHRDGLIFPDFRADILFTMWLTVLASVAMGFIISSVVRSGDKAMAAAPFVLIVQLLFSGILFTLEGAGEKISYCSFKNTDGSYALVVANGNDTKQPITVVEGNHQFNYTIPANAVASFRWQEQR